MGKANSESNGLGALLVLAMGGVLLWWLFGRANMSNSGVGEALRSFFATDKSQRTREHDLLDRKDRDELDRLIDEVAK